MSKPTPEQIAKLPMWARGYIADIERQRQTAIDALNDHLDHEKASPFYVEDMLCTGEQGKSGPTIKRRNFQSWGRMCCEHAGVKLSIYLRDSIEMQWDSPQRGLEEIALVPASFQQVRLVARSNMR